MIKYLFFSIIIILSIASIAQGSPASHADSLKARSYWDSANYSPLYSQQRQLYLDSALAILPGYAYWWQQKSHPLFKQHKYQVGLPYIDSAVKYDKDKYLDYRAYMKCIFQKDYIGAIKDFEGARGLHGVSGVMDHSYDFYEGLCYLQLDKFDSAEYLINKSIAAVRNKLGDSWVNSTEWFYMGIVTYEKQDLDSAIACFDKAITIYKNFSDAKYYKAICLMKQHKNKEALEIMLQADADLKEGYTIIEDGVPYELYPYQINQKYYVNNMVKYLQELAKS